MFVKVCGLTRLDDVQAAHTAGADCFGVLFDFPRSPRSVTFEQVGALVEAAPLPAVLVTVNLTLAQLDEAALLYPLALQLHGDETPDFVRELRGLVNCEVWKVLHVPPGPLKRATVAKLHSSLTDFVHAGSDRVVIDTRLPTATDEKRYGGTGVPSDWVALREVVAEARVPVLLTGGLTPANVATAIELVRPAGVDASSGVETAPGVKDPQSMAGFVTAARADRQPRQSRRCDGGIG